MHPNEIDTYLQELEGEVASKRSELAKIEEEIQAQDMAYELKRAQAEEHVRQELVDYEGQGLGVSLTESDQKSGQKLSKPGEESILKVLKTIFE